MDRVLLFCQTDTHKKHPADTNVCTGFFLGYLYGLQSIIGHEMIQCFISAVDNCIMCTAEALSPVAAWVWQTDGERGAVFV